MRYACDAAADHIADTNDGGPAALRQFDGGHGVGGLSALADRQHDIIFADDGIPVAELARVFDFHGDPCDVLEEVFCHQACVPAGAARHDHDAFGVDELLLIVLHPAQHHFAPGKVQAPAHAVADAARLLEDLLEHEMVIAPFLQCLQVHLQFLDEGGPVLVPDVADLQAVLAVHDGDLTILQVHHVARMLHDGTGIRGHEVFTVLPDAHDQGAAFPRRHQRVRVLAVQHHDGVSTHHAVQGKSHRFREITLLRALDVIHQMHEHFGVGVALEHVTTVLQLFLQRCIVLDDAVVDQGEVPAGAHVRVCVHIVGLAVCGPPRVTDADGAFCAAPVHVRLQVAHLALAFVDAQGVVIDQGHPCAVVPAVLQALEAVHDDRVGLALTHVGHDSAHDRISKW